MYDEIENYNKLIIVCIKTVKCNLSELFVFMINFKLHFTFETIDIAQEKTVIFRELFPN